MGPGFLIVYSEPGKEGSLNKFQDLYNWHKHVSLPLHHLESFLSDDTTTFPCESYTFYTQTVHLAKLHLDESSLSSSLKSRNPTKYLVTHGITWGEDGESEKAVREWAETSVTELKKTKGWTGLGIPEGPEVQKVLIYFAVHESLTPEAAESYAQHVAGNMNMDWYNNEHVPLQLRLHHLKSFLSDARNSASDSFMGRSV
ncbi:hypothetical protein D9758_017891 [Tetrapyrgos nigripes]|uniref:Uncharacterized protein n=1 Tax=Tetrapyrgos nigripes TaxID=182062 RepID=A0A8H5C0K7_9AGAR|nr:hypothetical protein D9758_017891 [Tetrapyrgos nigripes]